MPLLQTENLSIRFGGLVAVNRVSLRANPGEVLGMIGPNGSGKTTLFNLITGIYRPHEGRVSLRGAEITGLPPHHIARLGVARTFQASRLFLELTVMDNVILGMTGRQPISWMAPVFRPAAARAQMANLAEKAWDLLAAFSPALAVGHHRRARELTLVDRRRLEICRALAVEPEVLLLDEPSAGMDARESAGLMEEIGRLRAHRPHLCLVIIEHDMEVVRGLTDRVIVLNHGQKIAEGTFAEVAASPEVRNAYLGT